MRQARTALQQPAGPIQRRPRVSRCGRRAPLGSSLLSSSFPCCLLAVSRCGRRAPLGSSPPLCTPLPAAAAAPRPAQSPGPLEAPAASPLSGLLGGTASPRSGLPGGTAGVMQGCLCPGGGTPWEEGASSWCARCDTACCSRWCQVRGGPRRAAPPRPTSTLEGEEEERVGRRQRAQRGRQLSIALWLVDHIGSSDDVVAGRSSDDVIAGRCQGRLLPRRGPLGLRCRCSCRAGHCCLRSCCRRRLHWWCWPALRIPPRRLQSRGAMRCRCRCCRSRWRRCRGQQRGSGIATAPGVGYDSRTVHA